jgi:hypothetical protein
MAGSLSIPASRNKLLRKLCRIIEDQVVGSKPCKNWELSRVESLQDVNNANKQNNQVCSGEDPKRQVWMAFHIGELESINLRTQIKERIVKEIFISPLFGKLCCSFSSVNPLPPCVSDLVNYCKRLALLILLQLPVSLIMSTQLLTKTFHSILYH